MPDIPAVQSEPLTHGITVVVPVYNRAALLPRCLESVRAQTLRPLRLIVVDNASTDRTPEVARQWAAQWRASDFDVKVVTESRRGACHARQRGLDAVVTDCVMFFDSDDTMHSESAATALREFDANPGADIVAWPGNCHFLDGSTRRTPGMDGDAMDSHLIHSILVTAGYAVRTETLRDAGGWGNGLRGWDDWEVGVRLLAHGARLKWTPRPMMEKYSQEESITGTGFVSGAGQWEAALDKAEAAVRATSHPRRRHWINVIDYRRVNLAAHYKREGADHLADPLLERVMQSATLSRWQKRLLRLLFRYTANGHRGAGRVAVRLL